MVVRRRRMVVYGGGTRIFQRSDCGRWRSGAGPVVVATTNHHNYKINNKYNIKLLFYIKKKVFNFELINNLFLILKNLVF
jgi:hypothetical protein